MKYKILLIGRNKVLIGDFFQHLEENFEMQTSSMRFSDISSHIHYFQPHALVYCMSKEEKERTDIVGALKADIEKNNVFLVLTGEQKECEEFHKAHGEMGDMILKKPIMVRSIKEKVVEALAARVASPDELSDDIVDLALEHAQEIKGLTEEKKNAKRPTPHVVQQDMKQQKQSVSAPWAEDLEQSATETQPEVQETVPVVGGAVAEEVAKKHVLVIDDDPMMLKLIKEQLKDTYSVATAISGAIAYKFLESKQTNLIILDYEMPGENGVQVLEKIRSNPKTARLPVVFLTGVKDREKIRKLVGLKPQGYLLKPIDGEKLINSIKSIIG